MRLTQDAVDVIKKESPSPPKLHTSSNTCSPSTHRHKTSLHPQHANPRPTTTITSTDGTNNHIGTAGLGKSTTLALLAHNPSHIYFSGRSHASAKALIDAAASSSSSPTPPPLTFVPLDQTSLPSIRAAIKKHFTHTRLDILINNAGIMAGAPGLSADGYEIQFATNHLGHAMVVRELLPVLLRTARGSGSSSSDGGGGGDDDAPADVRIINLTSVGYQAHPRDGISFETLGTTQTGPPVLGQWIRYGQSKLANILFTRELARRHPSITTLAIHPGVVDTGLVTNQSRLNRLFVYLPQTIMGSSVLTPEQGCWNQVWAAAAAKKTDLVNGGFYMPVGHLADDKLDKVATDGELAGRLWRWTEDVLDRVE
ncbi:short-chain dehydrogenase/reductase family Oxidoreductase [Colletotrichum abscissum]|uniref:Short-chain dehydrogenase/reductase family Oxidoreductase n=1 Tax=Colletotrichum abscissum TaxID=1671311 RepID=A0A9Q0B4L4_9PEZI|nr:short-chain dehydrogenase/reductase family Oxidoreductase [Colletotrichum abscissum]KAI3553068.1 short-chain dehydrogenase/reductase family Oxidoreductase [Colletotrichum abscissum]KAK1513684.1 short-chain dehydrogenase/reductase family Oxidoreductase [Colletotrichum abscissum]